MKTIILLLLVSLASFSQTKDSTANNENKVNLELSVSLDEMREKNKELENQIIKLKAKREASIEMVEKVDGMYNNNFNRFYQFWGAIASIVLIIIPSLIILYQRNIIKLKQKEIFDYSDEQLKTLKSEFRNEFDKLNNIILSTNEDNSKAIKDEFVKTKVFNHYIAHKINELNEKYDMAWNNLASSIYFGAQINFHDLIKNRITDLITITKICIEKNIPLNKNKITTIINILENLSEEAFENPEIIIDLDETKKVIELLETLK